MNIAFFDFDGTVTTGDGFMPFIRSATGRRRVALGTLCLSPMVLAYRLGWVAATRMRQSVAWFAFRGRAERGIAALGSSYAAQVLPRLERPEALERIRWHQAQGDAVVIVSASLGAYLSPWCRERGLELLCTELETRGGTCTGWYRGGDCTGEEKARRIRERYELRQYPIVFAYGDTHEDDAMLALAHRRFFRWRELEPAPAGAGGAGRPAP